jgi:hypothetical protein
VVADVDDGGLTQVRAATASTVSLYSDVGTVLAHIREALHRNVTHEVDEQFLYKGKRVFDPHVKHEVSGKKE